MFGPTVSPCDVESALRGLDDAQGRFIKAICSRDEESIKVAGEVLRRRWRAAKSLNDDLLGRAGPEPVLLEIRDTIEHFETFARHGFDGKWGWRSIVAALESLAVRLADGEQGDATQQVVRFSEDYQVCWWGGVERFSFSINQARCIEAMHKAGELGLHQDDISKRAAVGGGAKWSLRDVFRVTVAPRQKQWHPAWDTLVKRMTPARYHLVGPQGEPLPPRGTA